MCEIKHFNTPLDGCCHDCYDVCGLLETVPPFHYFSLSLLAEGKLYEKNKCCHVCLFSLFLDFGLCGSFTSACVARTEVLKEKEKEENWFLTLFLSTFCLPCSLAQVRREYRFRGRPRPLVSTFIPKYVCDYDPCCPGDKYLWSYTADDILKKMKLSRQDLCWIPRSVVFNIRCLPNEKSVFKKVFEVYRISFFVAAFIPPAQQGSKFLRNYVAQKIVVPYRNCICCDSQYGETFYAVERRRVQKELQYRASILETDEERKASETNWNSKLKEKINIFEME